MPIYLVTGLDANGRKASQPVRATDADAAMAMVDFNATAATERPELKPQSAKPRATTRPKPRGVERCDFNGLRIASLVIRALGLLAAITTALALGIAVITAIVGEDGPGLSAASTIVPLIGLLLASALLYAFGEACLALRVLALNSYRD